MKTLALGAALCLGVLSVPAYAESPDLTRLQECMKTPSSAACKKDFEQLQKAFEDIANGKKADRRPTRIPGLSSHRRLGQTPVVQVSRSGVA
jgi:hypothetical protein